MDVSHLLDELNEAQRKAVTSESKHTLVLAGAGSGKTRVLIHRLAWLIQVEHVSPLSIMAVTFTNKAAGIAHRLLRMHWQEAGLQENFQILDSDDQHRILRRLIKEEGLDEAQWPARQAQWYINARKDEGQRPHAIEHFDNPMTAQWVRIYEIYQGYCDRAGLVDFADLCWWMNSRIPTPFSMPGYGCWPAIAAAYWW